MKRRLKVPAEKATNTPYRKIMRMVDGAVSDALKMHPDYITPGKMHDAKRSITKRVTGTFYGLLIQSLAEQSVEGPAALARRANQARRYHVSG